MEAPDLLTEDIRAFFRRQRSPATLITGRR